MQKVYCYYSVETSHYNLYDAYGMLIEADFTSYNDVEIYCADNDFLIC